MRCSALAGVKSPRSCANEAEVDDKDAPHARARRKPATNRSQSDRRRAKGTSNSSRSSHSRSRKSRTSSAKIGRRSPTHCACSRCPCPCAVWCARANSPSVTHARCFRSATISASSNLHKIIVAEGLNVREVERRVREAGTARAAAAVPRRRSSSRSHRKSRASRKSCVDVCKRTRRFTSPPRAPVSCGFRSTPPTISNDCWTSYSAQEEKHFDSQGCPEREGNRSARINRHFVYQPYVYNNYITFCL